MKGKSIIELRDVHTGEVERHVDHNLVTNGMKVFPGAAIFGITEIADSSCYPLWKNWFSGLRLFENSLEEDPDNYIYKYSEPITGYASNTADTTDPKRGLFNVSESGPLEDHSGVRLVWDFAQNQANGQISCISIVPNPLVTPDRNRYLFREIRMDRSQLYTHIKIDASADDIKNAGIPYVTIIGYDYHKREAYFAGKESKTDSTIKIIKCIMEVVNITPAASFDLKVLEEHTIEFEGWNESGDSSVQYIFMDDYLYVINLAKNNSEEKVSECLICKIDKKNFVSNTTKVSIPWPAEGYNVGGVAAKTGFGSGNTLYVRFYKGIYKVDTRNLNEFILLNDEAAVIKTINYPACLCDDEIMFFSDSINATVSVNVKTGLVTTFYRMGLNYTDYRSQIVEVAKGIVMNVFFSDIVETSGKKRIRAKVYAAVDTRILYTINNLATPVIKTADKTMKITYILTNE